MTNHYGLPDGLPQGERRIGEDIPAAAFTDIVEARDSAPGWFAPTTPPETTPASIPGWEDPAALMTFAITDDGGNLWLEHDVNEDSEEGCPVLSLEAGLKLSDLITAAAQHLAEGCPP